MDIKGEWSKNCIEDFLNEAKIPIRIACNTEKGLWIISLWFKYEENKIYCATSKSSDIINYLKKYPEIAFEISTNKYPYKGIRGRGKIKLKDDPEKKLLRELFNRYIQDKDIPLREYLFSDNREETNIIIDPTSLYSWDFTERM